MEPMLVCILLDIGDLVDDVVEKIVQFFSPVRECAVEVARLGEIN